MADETTIRRVDVLAAFQTACPRPSASDLADWIDRHPNLADDLREHAEAMLGDIQNAHLRPEPSEALLARTRSAALDVLAAARARASEATPATLEGLLAAAGSDVPKLARALGLGRAPLVDLVQGRVNLPAPAALLATLADALGATTGRRPRRARRAGSRSSSRAERWTPGPRSD